MNPRSLVSLRSDAKVQFSLLECTKMLTPPEERRRATRATVMLSVTIARGGKPVKARLTNVSTDGASVVGVGLGQGRGFVLQSGRLEVPCRVQWRHDQCAGLNFEHPVHLGSIRRPIAKPRPRTNPRSGRPGLKCVPLSSADRTMFDTWAERRARVPE